MKATVDDEELCNDANKEDEEKVILRDEITKLKEKCELLVKEKENLESELKKKVNEDLLPVRFKLHEPSGFFTESHEESNHPEQFLRILDQYAKQKRAAERISTQR